MKANCIVTFCLPALFSCCASPAPQGQAALTPVANQPCDCCPAYQDPGCCEPGCCGGAKTGANVSANVAVAAAAPKPATDPCCVPGSGCCAPNAPAR